MIFFANRSSFKANLGCMTFPLPGDPCDGAISVHGGFRLLESGYALLHEGSGTHPRYLSIQPESAVYAVSPERSGTVFS